MTKYIVMIEVWAYDDTYDVEYTGAIYDNYHEAAEELREAREDPKVYSAYIKKI